MPDWKVPLADVRVMVVNSSLGALTNAEGRYTLRGVPAEQAGEGERHGLPPAVGPRSDGRGWPTLPARTNAVNASGDLTLHPRKRKVWG